MRHGSAPRARDRRSMKKKAQFLEAWALNQGMNTLLLGALQAPDLLLGYHPRARNVKRIWVHMHSQRLNWMGSLMKHPPDVARLKGREALTVEEIGEGLSASGEGIAELLREIAGEKRLAATGQSPAAWLAYMVAHEAHHRGQIILSLRLGGRPLPREFLRAMWGE